MNRKQQEKQEWRNHIKENRSYAHPNTSCVFNCAVIALDFTTEDKGSVTLDRLSVMEGVGSFREETMSVTTLCGSVRLCEI